MRRVILTFFLFTFLKSFSQKTAIDIGKASVYCEAYPAKEHYSGKVLQGTGFIVEHRHSFYFITSYHNIVNHDFYSEPQKPPGLPYEKIRLVLQRKSDDKWGDLYINLLKDDSTLNFYKATFNGKDVDIVAIPLIGTNDFLIQPVPVPKVSTPKINKVVFIVGFPDVAEEKHFQLSQFGQVIPNPKLNDTYTRFENYPLAFVNRRTSAGFSGSPVYLWERTSKSPVLTGINAAVDAQNDITIFWRVEILQSLLSSIP